MIGSPPSETGAFQKSATEPFPGVAVTMSGLPGRPAGVTGSEGSDAGPAPAPFVALTVNVYATPLVSPVTVMVVIPVVVAVMPSGLESTVYPVTGSAFAAGAVQLTVALPSPRTAVTPVGFPGTVPTRTGADASDGGPSPAALVAMTTNV